MFGFGHALSPLSFFSSIRRIISYPGIKQNRGKALAAQEIQNGDKYATKLIKLHTFEEAPQEDSTPAGLLFLL
jgi:hypothetical protein